MKHEFFIQQMESPQIRDVARAQLKQMQSWAESPICRRETLLGYFDEVLSERPEPCCDVCSEPGETEDGTIAAQMLLSCAIRTGERFGLVHLIDVLRGARSERVLKFGHDRIPTHGVGRTRSKDDWMGIGRQLIHAGFAIQNQERFGAIQVTARGRAVLTGKERVTIHTRPSVATPRPEQLQANRDLFDELRALRKSVADERGVPPYVIFHDRTLQEMAGRLPGSVDDLLKLPGVGTAKATTFGDRFLQVVGRYAAERGLPQAPLANGAGQGTEARRGGRRAGDSMRETLDLFRQGMTVADIARERSLALSTVENHLAEALEAGEEIEVDRLVAADKLEAITDVLRSAGDTTLTEIQNRLGDEFSFAEIRMARALRRYE